MDCGTERPLREDAAAARNAAIWKVIAQPAAAPESALLGLGSTFEAEPFIFSQELSTANRGNLPQYIDSSDMILKRNVADVMTFDMMMF